MINEIKWGNKISEALERAESESKLVFLDFFRPD
jgi:hypothetical protein